MREEEKERLVGEDMVLIMSRLQRNQRNTRAGARGDSQLPDMIMRYRLVCRCLLSWAGFDGGFIYTWLEYLYFVFLSVFLCVYARI